MSAEEASAQRPTDPATLHAPVMVDRVVELLSPALQEPPATLVDATLGMGGHSVALLGACPAARLVGIDRDEQALVLARARLQPYAGRVCTYHGRYDEITSALTSCGAGQHADAVLLDLGVSSLQIDDTARGFSYSRDTSLDMRMDVSGEVTAADVVNSYSQEELTRVFREYGEERFAGRIARAIVRARTAAPLRTSAELTEVVSSAVPAATRRTGHPAKRIWQALRIEVNDELAILDRALPRVVSALRPGGRMVVLSYHSLEDRRVKQLYSALARPMGPDGLPLPSPMGDPVVRILTRGAEQPDHAEITRNPRAGSARLRAVEKLSSAASPRDATRGEAA